MLTFQIGKFYRVPAIKTLRKSHWYGMWMPIIGPLHRDIEILKFPPEHWHVDWRFAPERALKLCRYKQPYSEVVQVLAYDHCDWMPADQKYPQIEGGVEMKRMRCKRAWPQYPHTLIQRHWGPALEKAFSECKLKPGLICPHRGISLEGAHREGDVVTCPGHGLRWNVKTGELVTTTPTD